MKVHGTFAAVALKTLAFGLILGMTGCGGGGTSTPDAASRNAVVAWNNVLLGAIRKSTIGPPATSRAIGMVHTAMFDAWANYDTKAKGTRLGDSLRRPVSEHLHLNKQKAVSYAAYRVLVDVYPAQKATFDAQMASMGYDPNNASVDTTKPEGIGNVVAKALLDFRHNDGSNQLGTQGPSGTPYSDYTGYTPVNTATVVNDPSRWQPITFANGKTPGYIAPHWGNVIPFSMSSPTTFRPPTPPAFGSPTYLEQVDEVLRVSSNLNDTQKVIAEYWANGPSSELPPGHWCLIAQYVSQRDNHSFDDDIKMFFLVGNAVMDAGIACWDGKRFYDSSRPFTAIRHLYKGKTVRSFNGTTWVDTDGANWLPYQSLNFITPPFPEYTSGHSTFSAAAAEVLKRFTGSDTYGNSVTIQPGWGGFQANVPAEPVTLSWATFSEAADQAGFSRLLGGIHFKAGDQEGRRCGRLVGESVYTVGMAYINGTNPLKP